MKPAPFDYSRPKFLADALHALAHPDREVKVLAGGQSLLPVLNLRLGHPEMLVDVGRLPELQDLTIDDGTLRIGAAVRQSQVMADERVRGGWPMLPEAIRHIGHPQIRARGTVCGSLAHSDPAAELPAVAMALGATVTARSVRGARQIRADDFFVAPFTSVLTDDELLTEVSFPGMEPGSGWAFEEFATRRGDFATAGAATVLVRDRGTVESCRLVVFGVAGTPVRLTGVEDALSGNAVTGESLAEVAHEVRAALDPSDDIHASGRFRAETAARLAAVTIQRAWEGSHD